MRSAGSILTQAMEYKTGLALSKIDEIRRRGGLMKRALRFESGGSFRGHLRETGGVSGEIWAKEPVDLVV